MGDVISNKKREKVDNLVEAATPFVVSQGQSNQLN